MATAENNPTDSSIELGESHPDAKETCRVILIGKTGSGKSTLGNKLLQEERFLVSDGCVSKTTVCEKGEHDDNGKKMQVVDTPGFFDTRTLGDNMRILNEVTRALALSVPGPHVFIFVLKWGRLTKEEMNAFDLFKTRFGASHLIIAFTHTEKIKGKGKSVKDFGESPQIKTLLETVGEKYVELSDGPGNEEEISQLHKLIDRVSEKLNNYYMNDDLEKMAAKLQSRIEKKRREEGMSEAKASKEVADKIAKCDVRKKLIANMLGIGASVFLGVFFYVLFSDTINEWLLACAVCPTVTLATKKIYDLIHQKIQERKKAGMSFHCISRTCKIVL